MLDELSTLRDAVREYRAAAVAAGLDWPDDGESPAGRSPDEIKRIFGVEHVPEQLIWFLSQPWPEQQLLLPNGGWRMPWPAGGDVLDHLGLSIGTPFPWRQQVPLIHFGFLLYTFVLADGHEGEIWRYEISPDAADSVRAATSLATLFEQWTGGIAAGLVVHAATGRLRVEGDVTAVPGLDPLAFPTAPLEEGLLHARQRDCGVDMTVVGEDVFMYQEELADEIDAVKASLGSG